MSTFYNGRFYSRVSVCGARKNCRALRADPRFFRPRHLVETHFATIVFVYAENSNAPLFLLSLKSVAFQGHLHSSLHPPPATVGLVTTSFARSVGKAINWQPQHSAYKSNLRNKQKTHPIGCVSCLAPQVGLEPTTPRLTAACSTDWAIKANASTHTMCALTICVGITYLPRRPPTKYCRRKEA